LPPAVIENAKIRALQSGHEPAILRKTRVESVTSRTGTRMVGICGVWPNIVAVHSSRGNRVMSRL
jgi:hypothetical protein